MPDFDPFSGGGATATAPSAGVAEFDPFKSGARAPEVEDLSAPVKAAGTNWLKLYGGPLEKLDDRLDEGQRAAFSALDRVGDDPKEIRARAVNQAFVGDLWKPAEYSSLSSNWPALKTAFAKDALGVELKDPTDSALYAQISAKLAADRDAEVERTGEIKPWTWRERTGGLLEKLAGVAVPALGGALAGARDPKLQDSLSHFWESINRPSLQLPDVDPNTLPDQDFEYVSDEGIRTVNPARVAAVYRGIKPALEGATSPLSIATVGGAQRLHVLGEVYPEARAALAATSGIFTGLMAKGTIESKEALDRVKADPGATELDKIEAETNFVTNGAMTLLGALGTAMPLIPKERAAVVAKVLTEEGPRRAAAVLREEAAAHPDPESAATIAEAAVQLEEMPGAARMIVAQAEALGLEAKVTEVGAEPKTTAQPEGVAAPKPVPDYTDVLADGPDTPAGQAPRAPRTVAQQGDPVSIKNATVDAFAAQLGREAPEGGESLTFAKVRADVAAKVAADPNAGTALVNELRRKVRPITAEEDVLLTFEMNRRRTLLDGARQDLLDAVKNGDRDAEVAANFQIAGWENALAEAGEVATSAGTANAQALAFRRLMLAEDYTLAQIERRARVAKSGRPLKAEELSEVRELSGKLEGAEKALADYRARESERVASGEVARAPSARSFRKFISEQADAARARIKKRLSEGRVASGLDPADLADHALVGADILARGVTDFAKWSAEIVKEFGERIRPHLAEVFARATQVRATAAETARAAALEASAERRTAALAKRIAELEAKVAAGDASPSTKAKVGRPEATAELEKLAQRRDELNRTLAESRKAEPLEPLDAYKKRLEERIAKLEDALKSPDLGIKPEKPALTLDKEALELEAKRDLAKREVDRRIAKLRYDNSPIAERMKEQGLALYDGARLLMTSGEFSFILRQGKALVLSRPLTAAKAIPNMFRAFAADPAGAHAIDLEVHRQPEARVAKNAGLHLVEEGAPLSRQEEFLMSKLAETNPILIHTVGRFNRAATVFLNRLRFDVWKAMREGRGEAGDRAIATFVNEATGRGSLGPFNNSAVALGRLMFSPRFLTSRIQFMVGHSLWAADWQTRAVIAKEYARTLVALGAYYGVMKVALSAGGKDVKIGDDPRSSDFGKFRIGDTRIDPLAGVAQVGVFLTREATGETASARGKVRKMSADDKVLVAARFARSKLHPVIGSALNLYFGKDLAGNQTDLASEAMNYVGPMTWPDVARALQDLGLPDGATVGILAMLGEGIQTYDETKRRPK